MNTRRHVPLLEMTVDRAVVAIVEARLDAAAKAAARLENTEDDEALHDVRVGVRRLRGALRAYRPWLGKAASRKLRARLREITRSTNRDREIEVEADWIRECRRRAPVSLRPELSGILEELSVRERSRRKLACEVETIEAKIRDRLKNVASGEPGFDRVYSALAIEHEETLAARLASIQGPGDVESAHRARIAAKHLRYLLEPVARELASLGPSVEALASLQDVLGALHDAQLFEAKWREGSQAKQHPSAAAYLLDRNTARRQQLFARLQSRGFAIDRAALRAAIDSLSARSLTKN